MPSASSNTGAGGGGARRGGTAGIAATEIAVLGPWRKPARGDAKRALVAALEPRQRARRVRIEHARALRQLQRLRAIGVGQQLGHVLELGGRLGAPPELGQHRDQLLARRQVVGLDLERAPQVIDRAIEQAVLHEDVGLRDDPRHVLARRRAPPELLGARWRIGERDARAAAAAAEAG